MKLFRWQRECLDAWMNNGNRGIVHVATGAGKTVFALAAIRQLRERWPDLEVRVVVPTIPLARQWSAALAQDAPSEAWRPGLFGGSRRDDDRRQVMIYIINSARGALAAHMRRTFSQNHHALLICDECHHCQSPQNRRIFDFISGDVLSGGLYASIGLSATPFGTEDDALLVRALGPEIYRYDVDDAVEDGVLSRFTVCSVSASFMSRELAEYCEVSARLSKAWNALVAMMPELETLAPDARMRAIRRLARQADMDAEHPAVSYLLLSFRRREISHLAQSRILCCVALAERLRPEDRALVFCERISQAEALCAMLRLRGVSRVSVYHSGMSPEARKRNMDAFRRGETRLLVSCRCLDEGIDVPEANIGIVMSSSAVSRQRIQRLGRIVRSATDKDAACMYYIYIRESGDDASYLPGLDGGDQFALRYYIKEDDFSNEIYEYIASELMRRAASWPEPLQRELRACLVEGLTRADWLLPAKSLRSRLCRAKSRHEQNYWRCMARVADRAKAAERTPV